LGKASRLEHAFATQNIPHQALSSGLDFRQFCGLFQVSAQTPLTAVSPAFGAILESIEDLKTRPISESELNQAKAVVLYNHRANMETETGLADQVTTVELFDLARDFLSSFPSGRAALSGKSPGGGKELSKQHPNLGRGCRREPKREGRIG
jgi:predicted Zn-dependent peptidase